MSWTDRSGREIPSPPARGTSSPRRRKHKVTSLEALRLRDLLVALLVFGLELSAADAAKVLSLASISPDHVRRRLKPLPRAIGAIMGDLLANGGG